MSGGGSPVGAGDDIFVFGGSYSGGVVLGANETLIGQSTGLTVGSQALLGASGANPVITSPSGADVTLGDGDQVTGVNVTDAGGAGISAERPRHVHRRPQPSRSRARAARESAPAV